MMQYIFRLVKNFRGNIPGYVQTRLCQSFSDYHARFTRCSLHIAIITASLFLLVPSQAQKPATIRTINMETVMQLQYDIVRFKVKPGDKIRIILKNVSDMSHNLLIVKPGTRLKVVNETMALAEKGPGMNYIPKSADVMWSIPLVAPGQVRSLTFTAPTKPGIYPYVCTYPGHGYVMYGAMYVMQEGNMPDIRKDLNIPESRRQEDKKNRNEPLATKTLNPPKKEPAFKKDTTDFNNGPHPYFLSPPYLYHAFIDGVSPAAIAVHLPKNLSYCWDSESCRMTFAWQGGFVDMTDLWKGHFNASAKILGEIFFRDQSDPPLRLGEHAAKPRQVNYKGYRLVNGYPEFHYVLDGLHIYELIREKSDGNGLIRSFRIPDAKEMVWFFSPDANDAIAYTCSTGKWMDGKLRLLPDESKTFDIIMMSYHLAYKKKK